MQPKISIIVPIYKVERYLRQCVNSILVQTYTNLEIILVDDGSPDRSGIICDDYAAKDNRIIVIHKENGGLSSARNAGLDIASGEFIGFIDSDDWIEPDMYEFLYNNLSNSNADISMCGYYYSYKNQEISYIGTEDNKKFILNSEKAVKLTFTERYCSWDVWNKLYKKYIFNTIRFPLGKTAESVFIITEIYSVADKIVADTIPKYHYRQRQSSVVHEKFNLNTLHPIEAFEYNFKVISKKYPNLKNIAMLNLLESNLSLVAKLIMLPDFRKIPEFKKALSTLRQSFGFIMTNRHSTRNTKIKGYYSAIEKRSLKEYNTNNDRILKTKYSGHANKGSMREPNNQ